MREAERLAWLEALGIDAFVPRGAPQEPDAASGSEADAGAGEDAGAAPLLDWDALRAAVADCTRCEGLAGSRTQTVFGVGSRSAEWMIVGEAPGAEEDRRGEPFVGRAGKLLDEMLRAAGHSRDSVYIANMLKCRPPRNRDPSAEEMHNCRGYLERQIGLVDPKLILAVGRIAAQQLLGTDAPLGRLRGKVHVLSGAEIPVIVTYHPAYLLRTPADKRKAWQDLRLALRVSRERQA